MILWLQANFCLCKAMGKKYSGQANKNVLSSEGYNSHCGLINGFSGFIHETFISFVKPSQHRWMQSTLGHWEVSFSHWNTVSQSLGHQWVHQGKYHIVRPHLVSSQHSCSDLPNVMVSFPLESSIATHTCTHSNTLWMKSTACCVSKRYCSPQVVTLQLPQQWALR